MCAIHAGKLNADKYKTLFADESHVKEFLGDLDCIRHAPTETIAVFIQSKFFEKWEKKAPDFHCLPRKVAILAPSALTREEIDSAVLAHCILEVLHPV